ncbi:hypothetical protein CFELI_10585 [Corynebacterium felinum]|uniref:Uncharacterized protein n=1 Tax=Corynebacterium felinum TaxID=131318 RepID=A0ABU2B697_9CORY|nr:hypothetical protein [Corynebacterium felinum]WJY95715.1 hypothetical protein CFELI_10585 [Corynebacterium felinum]
MSVYVSTIFPVENSKHADWGEFVLSMSVPQHFSQCCSCFKKSCGGAIRNPNPHPHCPLSPVGPVLIAAGRATAASINVVDYAIVGIGVPKSPRKRLLRGLAGRIVVRLLFTHRLIAHRHCLFACPHQSR